MAAERHDISTSQRIHLAAQFIVAGGQDRSELAREAGLSRPSLYAIGARGQEALSRRFAPRSEPAPPGEEGYWLWVDANAVKRLIVALRGACGAPIAVIALLLLEAFGLRLGDEMVRAVLMEGYQRAFEYQQGVRLGEVTRAAFDEMYRWGHCILTGVDCDSLFIFLAEKQPGCGEKHWAARMKKLRDEQGLNLKQIALDGLSAIKSAARKVWGSARIVLDIAHVRIYLEQVRGQFEQKAYAEMERAEKMQARHSRGPTRRTSQAQLDTLLAQSRAKEREAIELASEVAALVEEAHGALNIIDPRTGHINVASEAQVRLQGLGARLKALGTTHATWAGSYLQGKAQQVVLDRTEFSRVMLRLAQRHGVPFEAVEKAAWIWEVCKQCRAARWSGTREALERQLLWLYSDLDQELGATAPRLLRELFIEFYQVLSASSPVEWANGRIAAILGPQKRLSSGLLVLRTAFLNLRRFEDGRRKGFSPHELLTQELVPDWLTKLGYSPKAAMPRSLKSLGWRRLVRPFEQSWRQTWLGDPDSPLDEAIDEAAA